ncbi:MAG: radical SAM (seleno)protein TrsS [Flexilinea sp.]|jgi:hypothetical protein
MTEDRILTQTFSVCPECLKMIPAVEVQKKDGNVYLEKSCSEHGIFSVITWRGSPALDTWGAKTNPVYPENAFTEIDKGCPYDCGLCPDHRQQPCCVLLEVTQRCNLGCPVCYASSKNSNAIEPSLDEIRIWFEKLMQAGGPFNIQLSGGEPTLREDLPEIIRMGRQIGFNFFQLNTNGIRIAGQPGFIETLKEAGLNTVYLQFDGTDDLIYQIIRGRPLMEIKKQAIERCKKAEIGVVLVPTVIPGINDQNLGEIVLFSLSQMPTVRCVHIQPVCYTGRNIRTPENDDRLTIPEIFHLLEIQTNGLVKVDNFKPGGGQHPMCGFQANFVLLEDGSLKALSKFIPNETLSSCCSKSPEGAASRIKAQNFVSKTWSLPEKKSSSNEDLQQSFGGWDKFLERKKLFQFTISGMAFQDAWNLDLDRLKSCYIMVVSPEGNMIPFCACNLTDRLGKPLYR